MINKKQQNNESIRDQIMTSINELSPDFADYMNKLMKFHESRSQLNMREREIAILSSLVTQGSPKKQLKIHIQKALKFGLSSKDIAEVFIHISLYSGMPSSVNALLCLHEEIINL